MPVSVALASFFLIAQAADARPAPPVVRLASQVAVCPSPSEVASALRQALGGGRLSSDGWVLSYGRDAAAGVAGGDASLWMVLADPSGESLVERRIPASPEDCPAMAEAMTAVVERSLRTVGWTRGDPLPASARRRDVAVTAPQPLPADEPPGRPRPPRLVLGAGPLLGTSPRVGSNLLLEARVRVAGPFSLRLGGAVLSGGVSQRAAVGTARMTSRTFMLAPLLVRASSRIEGAVGPSVLFGYDQGSGDLALDGSGHRATLAVGVALAAAVRLSTRWRLSAGLEVFRAVAGADFFVELEGRRSVVLAPPTWEATAAVRLEFLPWP